MAWTADARWLGLLAEYLVKTTAVLSLALAVTSLLGRRSAALRHFVLSAFLVGLVLLPLLPSLPMGWETRWLPARPAAQSAAPVGRNDGMTWTVGEPLTIAEPLVIGETAGAIEPPPLPVRSATGIPLTSQMADAGVRPQNTESIPTAGVRAASIIGRCLPLAWSAGLLVLLLRLGLGLAGAARLSREGRPLDDSLWEALLRRFLAMVTLRRRVRLKSHGRVAIPMTWGLVRPVILFPEDSRDWDEGRRSAALYHELSHIKRADFAVMLLVRLSLALFWFNPLVWAVFRRLRREQEKACDELVLKAGIKPSAYARSLLLFRRAAAGAWGPSAALLGLASGSSLDERLAAILRQKMTIKEITMKTRIVLTIAIFSVVALVGSARPAAQTAAAPASVPGIAAAPAPVQEAAAVSQEKQSAEKAKEAEKAESKEKAKETKTIVITTSEAKKGQVEITVSEGGKSKTLLLGSPVVLKAAGTDKEITLELDGKNIVLKKGEQMTIVSKDGAVELIGEGEVHEHALVSPVVVTVEEGHPRTVIVREGPEHVVIKEVEGQPVVIAAVPAPAAVPAAPAPPGAPAPPAAPAAQAVPAPPAKVTTYEVVEDGKHYTIVMSPRQSHAPYSSSVTYAAAPVYGVDLGRKEIRGELQAIQEQVKKLEQRRPDVSNDLKAIEESLQALAEKLEKQAAKLEAYHVTTAVPAEPALVAVPGEHITVVGKDAAAGQAYGVVYSEKGEKAHVVSVTRGEAEAVTVIYRTGEVLKDEAAVARAVDKVKKALPQGYTVEPKADKESGSLTLTIKAPEGQKVDEGLVRKIVAILVEELKKDTAGKN